MYPTTEAYTDVLELCALLMQRLGFSMKSLNTTSVGNGSQESGATTVIINCQASGLQIVLESGSSTCSPCPPEASQQNIDVWQVLGIAGQQLDKEFVCSIIDSLPKVHRERLSKELHFIMRCIRESGESSDGEKSKEKANKSASMMEVKVSTEERRSILVGEALAHYRSLDTLTAAKEDQQLPAPGVLQKKLLLTDSSNEEVTDNDKKKKVIQQSTNTLWPPSPLVGVKTANMTSSPLQQTRGDILESLIATEQAAKGIRDRIATIIKQLSDEGKNDSSVIDFSKISLLKGPDVLNAQFVSSPNLSSLSTVYPGDIKKTTPLKLKTTSLSLVSKKTDKDGGMTSKPRPSLPNKNSSSSKNDKLKPQDSKTNRMNPKPVTPNLQSEPSPIISVPKNRFSHIKSTIPRRTLQKKE